MKATLVTNCNDWEGLYINGELVDQGHRINIKKWIGKITDLEEMEVTSEWLGEEVGNLPDSLEDIPEWAVL